MNVESPVTDFSCGGNNSTTTPHLAHLAHPLPCVLQPLGFVMLWVCDSFKNPGPDGVNFGFIKEF